jgi:hypothetical protein
MTLAPHILSASATSDDREKTAAVPNTRVLKLQVQLMFNRKEKLCCRCLMKVLSPALQIAVFNGESRCAPSNEVPCAAAENEESGLSAAANSSPAAPLMRENIQRDWMHRLRPGDIVLVSYKEFFLSTLLQFRAAPNRSTATSFSRRHFFPIFTQFSSHRRFRCGPAKLFKGRYLMLSGAFPSSPNPCIMKPC